MNSYNDIFNDIDATQKALNKVRLTESVMPIYKGRIVENTEVYDKVHKLLNCDEMTRAHKFLYDIDYNELNEDTINRVNNLYDYAVKNGFINDDGNAVQVNDEDKPLDSSENTDPLANTETKPEEEQDKVSEDENTIEEKPVEGQPAEVEPATDSTTDNEQVVDEPAPAEVPAPAINATTPKSCVCLYTAMKNGKLHTGECASDACDPEQAKYDVINKLTQFGYSDVNILAIEDGVPGGPSAQVQDYGQKAITNTNKTFDTKKPSEILMQDETVQESDAGKKVTPKEIIQEDEEIFEEVTDNEQSTDSALAEDEVTEAKKDGDDNKKDNKEKKEEEKKEEEKKEKKKAEKEEKEAKKEEEKEEEQPAEEEETIEEEPAEEENTEEEPAEEEETAEEDDIAAEEEPVEDEPADEPADEEPTEEEAKDEEPKDEEPKDDEAKDDEKPLTKAEKVNLAAEYIKTFKQILITTDATSYDELPLAEKPEFYAKLAEKWGDRPGPEKFMTKANTDKLESMKVEKENK